MSVALPELGPFPTSEVVDNQKLVQSEVDSQLFIRSQEVEVAPSEDVDSQLSDCPESVDSHKTSDPMQARHQKVVTLCKGAGSQKSQTPRVMIAIPLNIALMKLMRLFLILSGELDW